MPSFTKTFKHDLGKEEAVRRIRERISTEKINKAAVANVTREVWSDPYHLDFSMTVFKYRIDGALKIDDELVTLDLTLPMGAAVFKELIDYQISQQMDVMLK